MSDKHISFEDWEIGQPLDEAHLESCARCRRQREAARFLRFQAETAPRIDAPPFFAARVARLAVDQLGAPMWNFVERWSRRLIPVFAAFLMATAFLLYQSAAPAGDEYAQILLGPEERADLSLDDVVILLEPSDGEAP